MKCLIKSYSSVFVAALILTGLSACNDTGFAEYTASQQDGHPGLETPGGTSTNTDGDGDGDPTPPAPVPPAPVPPAPTPTAPVPPAPTPTAPVPPVGDPTPLPSVAPSPLPPGVTPPTTDTPPTPPVYNPPGKKPPTDDVPPPGNKPPTTPPGVIDDLVSQYGCGGKKISICHVPPGNPGNAHTICIAVQGAVNGHDLDLATCTSSVGDYCGPCK